tara:strand:+ start:103 stop:960 length:858 start_codon:yes stop_codon:yes gene_type:complete
MNVLIFGITGLIGSGIFFSFLNRKDLNVYGTSRKILGNRDKKIKFEIKENIDVKSIENIIKNIKPRYIINCIGITKHRVKETSKNNIIKINSVFPNTLSKLANKYECKLIQVSTDCVFSGTRGNYNENDSPDGIDLYAKTKIKGEILDQKHLTIRTSTIGNELGSSYGLMEWFLSQKDKCDGFSNAYFSGITTHELSQIIYEFVFKNDLLEGIVHISSKRISKLDLLKTLKSVYNKNIEINEYVDFYVDRSLDNSNFKRVTGYKEKTWIKMLNELTSIEHYYKSF